jgi:hypothetical protein
MATWQFGLAFFRLVIQGVQCTTSGEHVGFYFSTRLVPSGKLTWLRKITIFNGKTHYRLPFSIATLNYQRVTFYQGREAVSGQQRQCWELNVGVGHGWSVGSVISITHSSGHPHNHGFTIGSESKWRRQGHNKDSINLSWCHVIYVMSC